MPLFHSPRRRRPKKPREASGDGGAGLLSNLSLGEALAGEAEAFLAGRLAEHLVDVGRPVPPWALLNRLAHGSVEQLAVLAITTDAGWRSHPSLGNPAWVATERSLATRLLRDVPTPESLWQVQAAVLVPLELQLIADAGRQSLTPGHVMGAASRALDEFLLGR